MKRILSGIKPSGEVQLGNYLGAMRRWAAEQDGQENFFFIPNLHAITARQDPEELRTNTYAAVAWLLAMGVDTAKSTIFVQSQVPAHSELSWILNNYVTMGELNRMTQFKDKSQKVGSEGQLVGLFDYPVLMAADIILYDADEVPVGDDQKQHVELTRDIATRFNNLYGDTFKVPEPTIAKTAARVMDLQDPLKKMSKSDETGAGCVFLTEDAESIRQKFKRAVTDSGSQVALDDDKPAISNLLTIFSEVTGRSIESLEADYAGIGYGQFKSDLADAVVDILAPIQLQFHELMADTSKLDEIMATGADQARGIADPKIIEVKKKIGLF